MPSQLSTLNSRPAPQRLKLLIAYDGTPFRGWQSQRGGHTVQDVIENALGIICGQPVRVHGAGRTDAGVHATGQVAHCDVPAIRISAGQWRDALNARMPNTIRILRSAHAPADFHARFDAKGKIYRYQIWRGRVLPPHSFSRSWLLPPDCDIAQAELAAKLLIGRHDFASFAANRGRPESDSVRTIHSIRVSKQGPQLVLRFEGDGFLYKMVRLLTGSIIRVAQAKNDLAWIQRLLAEPGREKSSHAAPAHGLYLDRVLY